MDRWIAFDKGDFIGRAAALKEHEGKTATRRLVTLAVDSAEADATGYEPVWSEGRRVGFITSGGYGHTVGRSLAMALVEPAYAESGTRLSAHIVGVECDAEVIAPSPYDPRGERLRA